MTGPRALLALTVCLTVALVLPSLVRLWTS